MYFKGAFTKISFHLPFSSDMPPWSGVNVLFSVTMTEQWRNTQVRDFEKNHSLLHYNTVPCGQRESYKTLNSNTSFIPIKSFKFVAETLTGWKWEAHVTRRIIYTQNADPVCNRRIWQQLFVFTFTNFPFTHDRSHSICITFNLGVPSHRWIKYHGTRIWGSGSGFLSSSSLVTVVMTTSQDPGNGKEEVAIHKGRQRKIAHTNDGCLCESINRRVCL